MPADLTTPINGVLTYIYLGENTTEAKRQADRAAGFADEIDEVTGPGGAAYVDYDGRSVEQVLAELEYIQSGGLAITSMSVSPSQIETGDSQDVTVSWTIVGEITGQTLEGVAVTPLSARDKTFTAVSASNTYNLAVEDTGAPGGTASDSASAALTVLSKWYAGVNNDTSPADADLLAFGQSGFATSRARTITFDATGGGYPTYAWPAALGALSSVKANGLAFSDYTVTTRDVVNAHGEPVSMNIAVFNNQLFGAAIEAQFA